jgi:EAL and modified HD-GYP domain-containing signal transduction protein
MVRQPIVDRFGTPAAYEIHCQDVSTSGGRACEVGDLMASMEELPLAKVTGGLSAWMSVDPQEIVSQDCACVGDLQIVLSVAPAVVDADSGVIFALHALGYRVALDGPLTDLSPAISQSAPDQLDYVVLDATDGDASRWAMTCDMARPYGLTVIAKQVASWEAQQQLQDLGALFFQGPYLTSPDWSRSADHSDNRTSVVRLLNELKSAQASVAELEAVIRADPVMSFNLLKMINSAAFGLRQEVHSVRHALMYMGLDRVVGWARMLALGSMANRSIEVMKIALTRGRLLELQPSRHYTPEIAFEAGLFSMLEVMMGTPMAVLLDDVAVDPIVREAILFNHGELGYLLRCLQQYEKACWNANDAAMNALIWRHYPDAVAWADRAGGLASSG